jgi:hypothetical protein
VHSDRAAKPRNSSNQQRLPQGKSRPRLPHNRQYREPTTGDTAAETRTIMRDQRDEVRVDRVQFCSGESEIPDVLWHKNHRRAQDRDHRAGDGHARPHEQQASPSKARTRP